MFCPGGNHLSDYAHQDLTTKTRREQGNTKKTFELSNDVHFDAFPLVAFVSSW